ncbi:MAG: signal peptidase [Actinomycetota bacterium]|jgi:signal peptidase I|nr:signal peptidase [Actinomycetota bacterium]
MTQAAGNGPPRDARKLWRRPTTNAPAPEPETRSGWSLMRDVVTIILTALVASLLIKTFLVQPFVIPSGSMESTLHGCPTCPNGDRVLVNKRTRQMGGVQRGDVVVFRDNYGWLSSHPEAPGLQTRLHDALAFVGLVPTTSESHLVKRVIGVGGDTVEARDGKVYVNGLLLNEPYVFAGDRSSEVGFRVTVPADRLWVMGDHRSESGDSRFHQQGPGKGFVRVQDVVGRAFAIIWPLDRMGSLERPKTFARSFATAGH